MSLDVYLTGVTRLKRSGSGIFVRDAGSLREITREEWDERNPGHEPCVVQERDEDCEIYSRNITHNLNAMAEAAGIYKALWRPEEIGVTKAGELVPLLADGLAKLEADPERFKVYNPHNGWGSYGGLVDFVRDYLSACRDNPDADVSVSR